MAYRERGCAAREQQTTEGRKKDENIQYGNVVLANRVMGGRHGMNQKVSNNRKRKDNWTDRS